MTLQELLDLAEAADYYPSIYRDHSLHFASVRTAEGNLWGLAAGSSYADALQKAINELDRRLLLGTQPPRIEAPF